MAKGLVGGDSPPPTPDAPGPPPHSLAELGAWVLPVAMGAALVAIRIANDDATETGEPLVSLSFGVVCALPGLLALLARSRRPGLYLAAGMLSGIFAFISLAGVTLPLLLPAGMSLVAYGRHAGEARGRLADPVVAMLCWVLGIACFIVPFVLHQDPRCVSGSNGGGCSSDVVTSIEASVALAGVALTLFTGWALSRPRQIDG
jgi:hypothetical protein